MAGEFHYISTIFLATWSVIFYVTLYIILFTHNNFEFCNVPIFICLCEPVAAELEEAEGRQHRSGGSQLQNHWGKRLQHARDQ